MAHPALTLVPAIDLRDGRVVRLRQGDPAAETQYDTDPVARAQSFAAAGAARIHVVDLDGAFGEGAPNLHALRAICAAVAVPVQTGGGIRSMEAAQARFDAGAAYVVLGTVLVEDPVAARAIIERFSSKVIAGVDARGDRVAVRGWQSDAPISRDDLVRAVAEWGAGRIIYTEISRDGAGEGYDVAALAHVASLTDLKITASGGARSVYDLRRLRQDTPATVDAAIIGRALYEGTIDLASAIKEFN